MSIFGKLGIPSACKVYDFNGISLAGTRHDSLRGASVLDFYLISNMRTHTLIRITCGQKIYQIKIMNFVLSKFNNLTAFYLFLSLSLSLSHSLTQSLTDSLAHSVVLIHSLTLSRFEYELFLSTLVISPL